MTSSPAPLSGPAADLTSTDLANVTQSRATGEDYSRMQRTDTLGRIARWDGVADSLESGGVRLSGAYHRRLEHVYSLSIPKGARVLEVGSARGDLLASLEPAHGVGIDFAPKMVAAARQRHPGLTFLEADAQQLAEAISQAEADASDRPFDYVILSDLVNDLRDVQAVLEQVHKVCGPRTRVMINTYSRVWEKPLAAVGKAGLARPMIGQNWLTPHDLRNLLHLAGFETLRTWQEVLLPLRIPGVAGLCNRFLVKLPGLRHLALSNFLIARPAPTAATQPKPEDVVVSVLVPARNEAGNIENILRRTPQMGAGTELIFVEGGSSDPTWQAIERVAAEHLDWGKGIKIMKQDGKGKGDAVRKGFDAATGDVLMILDADMTVPPEDLPRFFDAWCSGKGEFVNGVRLVYPMADQAMRVLNLIGNKFFSYAFTWLLGQPIRDTLCGTKVLSRTDYRRVADGRHYFGDFDPFGDFDLLFGAAKLNLRICDLPIRYQARTYGDTNIQRWRSGVVLLRMTAYAARRLKFV
ncbi:MAG: glycosyltransferase [Planctomycetota bacterium]